MLLTDIKQKTYNHTVLETGGTAINNGVSPAVRFLFMQNDITDDQTVIDYGAGHGGNAKWLRDRGVKVYTYDPHHGTDTDGWNGLSNVLPKEKADVLFTSYVLNVVPENIEDDIIATTNKLAKHICHITRNKDIVDSVKAALERGDKDVTAFFEHEYGGGPLSDENIMNFCIHGTRTSKGFQRIPRLEHKGFNLIKSTNGYKIYIR